MGPGKRCFGIVAALVLPVSVARASDMGARATARGGVGLADAGDASGEEQNLAAVALDPRYVLYAGAGLGPEGQFVLRAGAVDSRTSAVALGAGYARVAETVTPTGADLPGWKPAGTELSDPTTLQRVHLGLAVPLLDRRLSFAVGGRYDWRDSAIAGADQAFNLSASVAGRPIEPLAVALGGRNLLGATFRGVSREVDLAVRYTPGARFGAEADITAPADADASVGRFQWRAGVDAGLADWLAVRAGWSAEAGTHYASAGVGLISAQAVLDYGVKVQLDDPTRAWHGLDLRVLF